jgi:hypothetical protein
MVLVSILILMMVPMMMAVMSTRCDGGLDLVEAMG